MEAIKEVVYHLQETYEYAYTYADPRVKDWPLMFAFWPTWALAGVYLLCVYVGPKLMKDREPFQLKGPLALYNLILVILNFHITYELIVATWAANYSYMCQPMPENLYDKNEMRVAKALWWYYFSKCIEFLDTIFFVLRKKNNQISFLHVYHHATMFPIWWVGVKFVPGGQAFMGAMVNAFIHVIMYTYYGLSALGPRFQKYLWWKRYLTRLQLIQFIYGMFHACLSLYLHCPFPVWMHWALIVYGMTILSLFINFYYQAYIKASQKRADKHHHKDGKAVTNGYKNGHVANGKSENKKANGKSENKKSK